MNHPASGTAPVVVVVGTGLVGASIGCALTLTGWRVHLRDAVPSHAKIAAGLGAGSLHQPDPDLVSLAIAAVPPLALPDVIRDALHRYPAAVVTDVGSVKAQVLDRIWDDDLPLDRYVGSHPMAGSERSGPVTARADLFSDRTWVITPHRRSRQESTDCVTAMVRGCGARPVIMDVDEHDAAVARVSHLPHLLSVLMAGHLAGSPDDHLRLAGQGLRDVTRLAAGDPDLWQQIVGSNANALLPELEALRTELDELIKGVADPASGTLAKELQRGAEGRQRIPGKHGMAAVSYRQVVVEIPDAPGALAHLFADVSSVGVNVEDIAIEHDEARQVGYLALSVRPEQADALIATIRGRGWVLAEDPTRTRNSP